jgi:hypothetical protein
MRYPSAPVLAVVALTALLAITPLAYVLSIGPAFALPLDNGFVDEATIRWFYQPVLIVANDCGAGPCLASYVEWWSSPEPESAGM